jgi:enamine deaminase RidA (YjgF/YER057c/UK114 family)
MTEVPDYRNVNSADWTFEIRCHHGPLAREAFVLCRPGTAGKGVSGQTASVYRALSDALRQEGGSLEHVVREAAFLRDIRRDLGLFRNARNRVLRSRPQKTPYIPASTFIQQAPVNEPQRIELSAYAVIPNAGRMEARRMTAPPRRPAGCIYWLGGFKHVWLSNIYGFPGKAEEEAYSMFLASEKALRGERLTFRNVVRTWIHLADIDRDYAGLNRGRTKFFREQGLALPPASTGIGGIPSRRKRSMCLSLYAVEEAARSVERMSAPTLNEAWAYGSDFSRGLNVTGKNGRTLFLSGTASVDEEGRTAHSGQFEAQAERMLLNISALLAGQKSSWRDVVCATTYLKHPADASRFSRILAQKGIHGFPHGIVQADVCRSDLLCEMEAIAIPSPRSR